MEMPPPPPPPPPAEVLSLAAAVVVFKGVAYAVGGGGWPFMDMAAAGWTTFIDIPSPTTISSSWGTPIFDSYFSNVLTCLVVFYVILLGVQILCSHTYRRKLALLVGTWVPNIITVCGMCILFYASPRLARLNSWARAIHGSISYRRM